MSAAASLDLAPYLRPARFVDSDHPTIVAFAREKAGDAATDRERAIRLYLAVRDEVRYDPYSADLEPEALTASATLARRRAFCVPKAILLAAALRAREIPARLGFADVTNHLATPRLLELLGSDVFAFHGYVEAYLEGRWVKATPAFDAALCAWFGVPPLAWDGVTDSVLQEHDGKGRRFMEYLCDRGVHADLPHDELVRVWREQYPHLFQGERMGSLRP